MVTIQVDGDDKTAKISDWTIRWSDTYKTLQLTCHFPSGKTYSRPLTDCRISPIRELGAALLTKEGSAIVRPIAKATIYGERYAAVHYPGSDRPYVHTLDGTRLVAQTTLKQTPVFEYFAAVADARSNRADSADQRAIMSNVARQLSMLPASPDTALQAYCTGKNETLGLSKGLIYPFGVNESQLHAVEQAFSAQVSVIEGPPGTGKTQTILNIIANILVRGQTVAVLSNNNAAVENVYEKLDKVGLGHRVARLGSKENRDAFFADLPCWPLIEPDPAPSIDDIQALLANLKQCLRYHNMAAQLQADIDELAIERRYLQQWYAESGVPASTPLSKYRLSPRKTADLMAYLALMDGRRVRLKDRIELLFNFRIFRTGPFAQHGARVSLFHALQMHYYDRTLAEKSLALQACREALASGRFVALLDALTSSSMLYLKYHLHAQAPVAQAFDVTTYRQNFDAFVKRFPIVGSSTHSIVNSIAQGAILDYVIIDEASQQDVVPGILALGCARNVVIVGDSRQLAHIPVVTGVSAPAAAYDCEQHSLLDSCIGIFADALPRTLLKEHYRCHPRIIQFCNQQFYGNALIPMTEDRGEASLRMVVTAKGNHARQNTNLRELDSLLGLLEDNGDTASLDGEGRGFIAPFRAQVALSGAHLPKDFVRDTVHKFQGRECDEIIFSTVLDKKRHNQERNRLDFVDDPRMINVAVSRAKSRFTLVTGDEVFTANNGHIAALIRYVEYYAEEANVLRAPVVSAFDLLYREYDQSLERLRQRLRPEDSAYRSEQIVADILRLAMSDASCGGMTYHTQVRLNQVSAPGNAALTERERAFMHRASCDFVLYFKVGKAPLGVIEVDGGSHDEPVQAERDALKDNILMKSGIPILRLRTVESRIEDRIAEFLANWTGAAPVP